MIKISFEDLMSIDTRFRITTRPCGGYDCYVNDLKLPGVLSQELILDDGVPRVRVVFAVKQYESDMRSIAVEAD